MNERIQKLYDQADKFAKENRTQTISGPGNNYFELFHEKFAQLIVKECVEQSMSIGRYNTPSNITPDLSIAIAVGLKKHFGVEE